MPTDFLGAIVERKKAEIATAKQRQPELLLREAAGSFREIRPFSGRLALPGPSGVNIIAEIKRASPSKGAIRPDLDTVQLASAYEKGGAAAISVLTDGPGFQGSSDDLVVARQSVALPVLRKDFIVSAYQIYESVAMGADALLLIVRILSFEQLKGYLSLCRDLRIDALVEVHSAEEFDIAAQAGAELVGINNRNLKTFDTDIQTAAALAHRLTGGKVAVAESGIHRREDILTLQRAGIFNFLIGESLVRSDHPAAFLAELMGVK